MGLFNKRYYYKMPSVGDIVRAANRRIEAIEHEVIDDSMRKYRNVGINEIREVKKSDPDYNNMYGLISRQKLYGYIDYRDGYVIGKNKDGNLFKINIDIYKSYPTEKLEETVDKIVKTAVNGSHFQNIKMFKLTYDEQNKKNFSIHTDWVDYKPGDFIHDANMYCGLHFTSLSSVIASFNDIHTIYGHRLVILSFPEELSKEVYYNYQSDYWCGDKVYVETTMDLSEVDTWKFVFAELNVDDLTITLKNSLQYLHRLENDAGLHYEQAISFIERLIKVGNI